MSSPLFFSAGWRHLADLAAGGFCKEPTNCLSLSPAPVRRPILEKDTVITIPPIIYYTIRQEESYGNGFSMQSLFCRYLELAGMVAVAGEWMEWDKDYARDLFEDDGLILAAFALSTVMMLVLGIIIRTCWLHYLTVKGHIETHRGDWRHACM